MKMLAPLAAVVFLAAVVQTGSVRKDEVSALTDLDGHKYIANAGEQSKIKKSEQMKIKQQKTHGSIDCRAKRKCTKKNGECKAECNIGERKIRKGCKGKRCKCCVLKKVCKKKAKQCKRKHGGVCLREDDCLENKFVVKGKCGKKCGLCCAKDDDDSSSSVKCGIEGPSSWRIINGVNVTDPLKYSWQIGMSKEDKPDIDYECGGSIITEKHILIAAHCFHTDEGKLQIPDELFIGIGSNDMKNPKLVITKAEVFVHEEYDHSLIANDVAIIELSKSVELLKNKIHPICLPKDDSKDYTGEIGTVTGWGGMTGHNPEPLPHPDQKYQDILQEAHTPILSDDECFKQDNGYIKEKMICASSKEGFENGGQGHCFGDSGGPFSVKYKDQHEQIGIVSFAVGCGSKGNPDFYTRVTTYLDWIKEKVGSEKIYTIA